VKPNAEAIQTTRDRVMFRLAAPTTQHEADVLAAKLFCVFATILVGLIAAGVV
jgi:hypothetical protein